MPRPYHLALICELSKQKKKNTCTLNSVPVVDDGAEREGVIL